MNKLTKLTLIATSIATAMFLMTARALNLSENGDGGFSPEAGKFIGAGLAVGLAGIGAGAGMGPASSAAIGAITEKPEIFGTAIIFIVLIEAVAIYGLLVALLLIFAA
jgi:V/A-type H+/Na+-transporting ATPase subunit K